MSPSPWIFTEPKDTLEYLQQKITARIGDPAAVVVIHGGIAREARRAAIAAFNSDPIVRVMIANDAAGEGVKPKCGPSAASDAITGRSTNRSTVWEAKFMESTASCR